MAVKLRLRRMGKKKQPFYRIVAIDSRVARNGKYIDKIGHYNPIVDPPEILIHEEKALLWLNRGAIPTDTVRNLFSKKGLMLRFHLMRKGLEQNDIDEEIKKWELIQIEKIKRDEALKAQQAREKNEEKEVIVVQEEQQEKIELKSDVTPENAADAPEDVTVQPESGEGEKENEA